MKDNLETGSYGVRIKMSPDGSEYIRIDKVREREEKIMKAVYEEGCNDCFASRIKFECSHHDSLNINSIYVRAKLKKL